MKSIEEMMRDNSGNIYPDYISVRDAIKIARRACRDIARESYCIGRSHGITSNLNDAKTVLFDCTRHVRRIMKGAKK